MFRWMGRGEVTTLFRTYLIRKCKYRKRKRKETALYLHIVRGPLL